MDEVFDVIVVGAGPAGCAAAYDLARAGRRVLLLDRRSFPRAKACACGLTRKTLRALRYSVDPIVERVCHEIVLQRATGPAALADKSAEVRVKTRKPICAMAVRERFDEFCLQKTIAAGAVFRRIDALTALRDHHDHVELDIMVTSNGQQLTETLHAPILIGADGSNGATRRLEHCLHTASTSEPAWYERGFALEAAVPFAALPAVLPAGDHPHDLVFDFAPLPGGYGWLFPKGDHVNIGVGAFAPGEDSTAQQGAVTRSLLAAYIRTKLGVDLGTLPPGSVTGQHLGMGGHQYVPRGRVLLAGDAAGMVDPLTGEGIHSALVSGQAVAAAILESSNGPADPSGPAAAYARHLRPLQDTLAFSHRAARAFYREPERGFRAMRLPLVRGLVLKTYADGLPHTTLLRALGKVV